MSTSTTWPSLQIPLVGGDPYHRLHFGPRHLHRADAPMGTIVYGRFDLVPATPLIGATVQGVDLGCLDDAVHAELHAALLEWKVLFFRDQQLSADQHLALARRWGPVEVNDFFPTSQVQEISRLKKSAKSPGSENIWHSDTSFRRDPSMLSVLRAVEVPPVGGDTLWADMAAAYDNLPDNVKTAIDGLTAVHSFTKSWGLTMDPDSRRVMESVHPPVEHPVVRTHPETGRKLLYVNEPFTLHIAGMDRTAGDALLDYMLFQARVPEYQCRLRWEPGTVAIWDNRVTQHYAVSDYYPQPRVMERVTIAGDRPW